MRAYTRSASAPAPVAARIATIDRASVKRGSETFDFRMVLATEGEASDGHVLSIRGGRVPDRMPLLSAHWADPEATLGSVVEPRKDLEAKPAALRALGQIELTGEGSRVDQRRDVALMIERGHLGAVSIRWEAIKAIPRRNLPSDHPAFVPDEEKDVRKRFGIYFEEWRALEGSVVPIGADPKALIQRSQETTGALADFWRSLAGDVTGPPEAFDWRSRALDLIAEGVRCAREGQVPEAELVRALEDVLDLELVEPEVIPPPASAPAAREFGADHLRALLAEHRNTMKAELATMFAKATGRRI
jgi:hypothetical protein